MELGTGLFLSAVFLGTIALFIATKDRWNWKRVARRAIGGAVVLLVLIFIGVWGYTWYEGRPVPQDELWGIKLGMNQAEVKYLKGEPNNSDDDRWYYGKEGDNVSRFVLFVDGNVAQIMVYGKPNYLPTVAHVSSYSDSKDIEAKLGKPTKVQLSNDSLRKMVVFENYRLWFGLSKEEIQAIAVFDPNKKSAAFKD
jgi:hypothetical protein